MRPVSEGADGIINQYYPVLDHGFIALVDYMGNDESIEHAARLSYNKGARTTKDTTALLRYLKRHRHTTPSEMVETKFHVAMPIFVARQWVRHRTASINEFSARYSTLPSVTYTPDDWRLQSATNKQGSSQYALEGPHESAAYGELAINADEAYSSYERLNRLNVAGEISRIGLPVSGYTQWYWKMDLHNLMHFLGLRCDPHAQYEIRVYADIIAAIVKESWPIMYQAFMDYQLQAVSFSSMEHQVLLHLATQAVTVDALDDEYLEACGLSSREITEFRDKMDWRTHSYFSSMGPPPINHKLPEPITEKEAFGRMFPGDTFGEES